MCGICGIVTIDGQLTPDASTLGAMNAAITHRGPDDDGFYREPGVGLAMRRLQIIDLAGGHQPICNEDGSVVVVFNGEIYDFQPLRERLQSAGHTLSTRSDTEVLVHLYEDLGDAMLAHVHGMFAFALWDARRRRLLLARDRMGKKPLHYWMDDERLVFGSELKSLLANPAVPRRLDPTSLARYLHFEYVPAPHTIYEGIRKLPPGHLAVYSHGRLEVRRYWDIPRPQADEACPDEDECARELERRLDRAVRRRLVSDVPLGVFLSGGIDSSSVTYFAARASPRVRTFSIRFEDASFDESAWARKVADHLGTEHLEDTLTPSALQELVPRVADLLDEPLGDASLLPTYLLSRFTRQHVTVALGGDGGDELFAGYPTYQAHRLAHLYRKLPRWLRQGVVERAVRALPVSLDNISFDFKARRFISGATASGPLRNTTWLGSFALDELSVLSADMRHAVAHDQILEAAEAAWKAGEAPDELDRVLYLDMKTYLQDDILVKVDRATMACSLEARAPLLDTEVVEYVSRLPAKLKLKNLCPKYLLKKAMRGKLPDDVLDRPKKGFGIPVARWAKGELRPLFAEKLARERIVKDGIFNPVEVGRLMREHLEGKADHRKKLWTLLVFQLWHERWL
ncbi:MAG: asparagine synthase (glutamine-hydrolyzing) [Candidatus Riflebacteria bacterium]|nr:asparagine synthase (glutamine-hydrolyzing) [Candidatus Riflebacteria bacterium]